MTSLRTALDGRREEFATHLALAQALEDRLLAGDELSIGSTILSARHLLTIKSGLLVHLYNIEEAIMSAAIDLVGQAVGAVAPKDWSQFALKEWLREHGVGRVDGGDDTRLESIHSMSLKLLAVTPLGPQKLKKPSGTWSDKLIYMFTQRIGMEFTLSAGLWPRIAKRTEFGDRTPLEFLAERRNALAHGRRSFEDGASDLTLAQIDEIASVTLDYLEEAASAFEAYVTGQKYLATAP